MKKILQKLLPLSGKITIALLLIISSTGLKAQAPANDDPCNAININPTSLCSFLTFTNDNATPSAGVPAPGCASYSGGDVWFKVTVPCSGSLTFDTQTGVITDGGMAIYS